MAGGNFGGGDGSYNNPYLVEDLADLDAVRHGLYSNYLQVADIIGGTIDSIWFDGGRFEGLYDGGAHSIKSITIRRPSGYTGNYNGLFNELNGRVQRIILENCTIENSNTTGGIVGILFEGEVTQCSVIDTKVLADTHSGYIVGSIVLGPAEVNECFALDTIPNPSSAISGIVGVVASDDVGFVENCYYRNYNGGGSSSGIFSVAGPNDNVSNCYSAFQGGVNAIGESADNLPSGCFFDREFSGLTGGYGVGKSTAEMKRQETFIDWDFGSIWGIDENINGGYPHLLWYPYKDDGEIDGTLNLHAKKNEIWHKAKDLYAKKNGVWSKAKDLYGNKQGWNKSE